MKNKQFKIELLTPALCHGADKNAEIRVPSIRGHLRKWHTILWGKDDMEYCWGTAGKDDTIASKVVLRIVTDSANLAVFSTSMLPHKKSALTNAVKNNQSFVLEVSYRYLEDDKRQSVINKVEKTIEENKDYSKLSVGELKELCAEKGIDTTGMKKADLVAALEK